MKDPDILVKTILKYVSEKQRDRRGMLTFLEMTRIADEFSAGLHEKEYNKML